MGGFLASVIGAEKARIRAAGAEMRSLVMSSSHIGSGKESGGLISLRKGEKYTYYPFC